MPTALATPEKALLILLDNEPLTVQTNMEISSYIEKTVAQSPDINNDLQAVLLSLTDRLLATSTELDTFNPLLSSLLNNLRVMTPQTILLVAKAITKNLAAEPNPSHQANVVNLATQLLPILASFMDPAEATKLYDDLIDFNSGYATTVCTLLREIDGGSIVRLTNEQLATALTHFTSAFAKTPPNNAPKLIYQVLLLYSSPDSGNNLTHQALDGITSWFDEHIAITTAPTPDQTFLLTASLSSFVSALRHSRSLGKTILKQITTSDSPTTATLRFERLTPFKIALSCTLASVNSNYKESSIAAMKELILEEIDFREKSEADHWVAASLTHTPRPPSYLLQTLKSISDTITITANSSAVETVVSTLISLAFSLVDAVKKDGSNKKGRPNTGVSSAAEAGREILSKIFCGVGDDDATTESIRRSIIKTLSQKCTGHAPNALEHSKLLSVLPKQHLFEFTGELVEWLGHLATGGLPPNAATTHLLPVLSSLLQKERQHLDVALVFAKKSLFSADITKRCAGASCLVALLGVSSTGSAEEEVVGYLKRCLTQQREVRWAVYSAVCQALNDEEMDEAQGQKVAKGMERLIHSQLDRVLEIQELEEVRQARRARAAAGEGGLSQMTQGGGDDDNVVVCPFQFLRVIGSGGEEGMLGESDKASGSLTLASAKRRVDEPLSFLLLAATACVAKLGPDCPLAQDLAMIRQKATDCEVDHYLQWTRDDEENTPTVPGDNSREVATCLVVAGVAESLTVGLDLSTEVGKKQTLAFLHLRAEAIKEGMYLTVPSDDALRKAKKAPEGGMDGSKAKKKKAVEGKGSDSNMLQERAEKAIVDYLRSDFQQLLDGASPNILTLISDSVYSSLMAFGGAMKDENGKKMISSSQLHQRIIMAGDLMATENLTGRMIPAIALKLSPVLLSEFSANVQRKSARTGPKKNGGGSLCGSALTGFLSGLKKMAGEIDGLSMTPVTRVNALFTKAFELSGLMASEEGAEPEEKLQGFLDAFTAPVGGVPQDSQTSRQGGVFVELVSVDAQEEACLICDAVSCAAGLLSNPNTRVRQGARMLNAWQEPNIAFEGQLGLSRVNDTGKTAVASNSSLKAVARVVSVCVELSGGLNGDTRINSAKEEGKEIDPLKKERSEMGFSTGFGGEYWPAFSAFCAVSFPVGCCGRIVISTVEGIGEKSNNFDDLKCFDDFDADFDLKGLSNLFTDNAKLADEVMTTVISACDKALGSAEYLFRLVGCSGIANGKISVVDLIGMRMLAVAEILSAMSPWAEFLDNTCTFACSILKTSKRLYALNTKIMTGMTGGKIEVGRMYRLFLTEMSERCTPIIAALMLGVQELQATGGAAVGKNGKNRYITSGAIQAHGRTAANLAFERERSDNAMAKYSKRLGGMGKSTLAAWVTKQILTTKARDFKIQIDDIQQAKEREMAALGVGEKKGKKSKKRKGGGEVKTEKEKKKKKKKEEEEVKDDGDELPDVPVDSGSGSDSSEEEGEGSDNEM